MRTIGVLAAIAALPGLLSGSLVARPWDGPGHGPSIQGAASALSVRTELPAPIQQEMMQEARGAANLTEVSREVRTRADLSDAASLPRPALIESPVAGGPVPAVPPSASFPSTTEPRAAVSALNGTTPLSFRLEDTLALRVSRGTSPVIIGPYDRLSPDHDGVPGFAETAAGTSYGPKPDQLEAVKADISERAAVSAPVPTVSAPDTGPVQNAEAAEHAVLAKSETNSVRTRMVGHAAPRGAAVPGIVRPGQQKVASPPGLPAPVPPQEMAAQQQQSFDYRPGTRAFPAEQIHRAFDLDDELILQIKIKGIASSDTVVAYGTRDALYLPLGEISRILDLAIRVSDDGHYANGWFLEEARALTVNLREQRLTTKAGERPLKPGEAQAFDGEMFLRSELFSEIFPLELQPNLRAQAIYLSTLEPFPFEERIRREAERARLGARDRAPDQKQWPRQETPWLAASLPLADVELRAISDSPMGNRLEGDLRLGGDLAFMTAQSYFSATTRDGLVASLVQLGRRDTEGSLLGPLEATDFQFGDVATSSMPVGLRGQAGRGAYVTNRPFQNTSVFEQIDLRGILPTGYEVELYRNDILVGSVRTAVNDQYEFLEVPVDYGVNVFRLVFYGPQGQRREEVRRVTVGDGRLAKGQFEYDVGVIQRGENLLGVRGPNFNPEEGFGSWQAAARLSYGLGAKVTAVTSLAYFQENSGNLSVATAGLRSGFGALAVRADSALGSDGSSAYGAGLGGRLLGGAFSLSHFEYGGGFRDEIRSNSRDPLRRATELDFNGSIKLGQQAIPIAARLRRISFANDRSDTNAILRSSYRISGVVFSNTLEYSRNVAPGGVGFSQLLGNFDLATFRRSRVQMRASVGYSLLQGPEITNGSAEVAYQADDRTLISAQGFHSFKTGEFGFGASAVREFDRFTLAIDGNYAFQQKSYSVALRIGFSLGRDPLRRKPFLAPAGAASSGAVSLRAFQDMDGNGAYGAGDVPLKDVEFSASNSTTTTDEQGTAQLTRLGNGNPVSVQVDPSSLPDIMMAPVSPGVEIVPRAGRFHVMDFPIVVLSEIEGTITYEGADKARGVSGLRVQLVDATGKTVASTRTERGGFYFFEQVKPGSYKLAMDQQQADRLGICMVADAVIKVAPTGDVYTQNAVIRECALPARLAQF